MSEQIALFLLNKEHELAFNSTNALSSSVNTIKGTGTKIGFEGMNEEIKKIFPIVFYIGAEYHYNQEEPNLSKYKFNIHTNLDASTEFYLDNRIAVEISEQTQYPYTKENLDQIIKELPRYLELHKKKYLAWKRTPEGKQYLQNETSIQQLLN